MSPTARRALRRFAALCTLMGMLAGACASDVVAARRLVEVADFSSPVVSPDGQRVAFRLERASVERDDYDSVWYVQRLDGTSSPLRVAEGGVPLRNSRGGSLPADAVWSEDGRWIYFRAPQGGRIDVWRAAADGSGAAPLTHDPADVRGFSLGEDGHSLSYRVGATRDEIVAAELAEYDHGIRIDSSVPVGQPLFRSGKIDGRLATQRYDGVWFERAPLLAQTPDRWRVVDLTTGAVRNLAEADAPRPSAVPTLPPGLEPPWQTAIDLARGRVALLTRVGDGRGLREKPDVQLSVLSTPRAAAVVECQDALCRGKALTGLQWRPDSDEVLFTVTDADEGLAQSIFRWNVATGAVYPLVKAAGLINGGRDPESPCGVSPRALVCVVAEADLPPRLERVDLETGARTVLFEPNAALAQDIARSAPARLLRWTDAEGRRFTGQFFAAQGADEPAPLFVSYYTCPGFVRGGLGDEWPLVTLAGFGISAVCINALPGYTVDAIERHDQGRSAVASLVAKLAGEGAVDPSRVGMGGLSYGGAVTMWTVTESHLLAAASISSPVVSPHYYLLGTLKGETFTVGLKDLWGLGAPEETPELWRALSPLFKLDRMSTPILFQMSEEEYLFALDYLVPLLREKHADLYVFPHEPHIKFQPRHKLAVYERNLDWFRFWLQGGVDPSPSKAGQYAAWRTLERPTPPRAPDAGD